MIEYFYDLGDPEEIGKPSVSYVVKAYDEFEATQLLAGLIHENYIERTISNISEWEYHKLQTDQMDAGVWRVTRENTRIIAALTQHQNARLQYGIRQDLLGIQDTLSTNRGWKEGSWNV